MFQRNSEVKPLANHPGDYENDSSLSMIHLSNTTYFIPEASQIYHQELREALEGPEASSADTSTLTLHIF